MNNCEEGEHDWNKNIDGYWECDDCGVKVKNVPDKEVHHHHYHGGDYDQTEANNMQRGV